MSDAPKPPPVPHAINCICARCIAARREERAGRGQVFRIGSVGAITQAYMFPKKAPTREQVEREMVRLSAKSRAS
jgi:hypothetical protein